MGTGWRRGGVGSVSVPRNFPRIPLAGWGAQLIEHQRASGRFHIDWLCGRTDGVCLCESVGAAVDCVCVCVCVCARVVVVCVAHRPVVVVVRSATGRHESLELPVTLRFTVAHRSAAEWIVAGRLSLAPFPYLDWVAALPIRVVVYCITRFVCISPCALSFLVLTKPSND